MFIVALHFEGKLESDQDKLQLRERFYREAEFGYHDAATFEKWQLTFDREFQNPEDLMLTDLVACVKQWAGQQIEYLKRIDIISYVDTETMGGSSRFFGRNCGPLWSEIGFTHTSSNPPNSRIYIKILSPTLIEESLAEFAKALPKFIRNIRICDLAIQARYRLEKQHDYSGVRRDLEIIINLASADCQNIPHER